MNTPYFTGPFAPMCEAFVAQKRASGLIYEQQAMLLKMFDNFCKGYEIHDYTITKEVATAWCVKRPNEKEITRHNRVAEMQRFAVFLCRQGHPSYLLPAIPKSGEKHVPYIFTREEMASIFDRLDKLEPTNVSPYRHLVYPLLFRMLYGCGLRISEALSLRRQDVDTDNGVLHILLGHADLTTTEVYAQINTEMKRKVLESAQPQEHPAAEYPSWTEDKSLMGWLESFRDIH